MGRAGERHRVGGGADDERLAVYSSFFVHSRFILASFIHSRFILISFRLMMIFVIYVYFRFHRYSEKETARFRAVFYRGSQTTSSEPGTAEDGGALGYFDALSSHFLTMKPIAHSLYIFGFKTFRN